MRRDRRARSRAVFVLAMLNAVVLATGTSVAVEVSARFAAIPAFQPRDPVAAGRVLAGSPSGTGSVGVQHLRQRVSSILGSSALGKHVAALVVDPASGRTLVRRNVSDPVTPASTTKLATGTAALQAVGPATRFTTRTVRPPNGTLFLVGGGDPTLAGPQASSRGGYPQPARLEALATRTVKKLRAANVERVRLRYDASLFTGPTESRAWKPGYVPSGYVAPVTALSIDSGRMNPKEDRRVPNPPKFAAEAFAKLLEHRGITVRGSLREHAAPRDAASLAEVHSPPVSALVEQMLITSDNDLAETLGRHVALATGRAPSFRGATTAVRQVLAGLGVPVRGMRLYDCSGLAHGNKMTARALVRILRLAASAEHPELRSLLTGLPVAGYSGTLADRFTDGPTRRAVGAVRAKTGTLNRVNTLAGVAYRRDGRMLVFVFLADRVPVGGYFGAEDALDKLSAALVR